MKKCTWNFIKQIMNDRSPWSSRLVARFAVGEGGETIIFSPIRAFQFFADAETIERLKIDYSFADRSTDFSEYADRLDELAKPLSNTYKFPKKIAEIEKSVREKKNVHSRHMLYRDNGVAINTRLLKQYVKSGLTADTWENEFICGCNGAKAPIVIDCERSRYLVCPVNTNAQNCSPIIDS